MTTDITTDITTDTAVFVSGPLSGQRIGITPGARRQPNYRTDLGLPMQVRAGDREFVWRPPSGKPPRHGHILQTGYWSDAYVHASVFEAWKAASGDARTEAVRYCQSTAPRDVAPQPRGQADPMATGDDVGAAPAQGRPDWRLAS